MGKDFFHWLNTKYCSTRIRKSKCVSYIERPSEICDWAKTLFIVYNDLPDCLSCKVSLFAYDTLIFAPLNDENDHRNFQGNINNIHQWSIKWSMSFNIQKPQLRIFAKKENCHGSYTLAGLNIAKYLGITLQNNLRFYAHIDNKNKIKKASQILCLIKTTLACTPRKN